MPKATKISTEQISTSSGVGLEKAIYKLGEGDEKVNIMPPVKLTVKK